MHASVISHLGGAASSGFTFSVSSDYGWVLLVATVIAL